MKPNRPIEIVLAAAIALCSAAALAQLQTEYGPVTAGAQPSAPAAPAAEKAPVAVPDYRVGPEDVLDISVWKEDALKKEVVVRPDGGVSFPLVGEVHAAGKTAEELRAEISERLKKMINDPVVSVSVLKVAANRIYVIGRVNRPGEFTTGRYVDVLQALTMAGGLTPFASENDIKIVRKDQGKDVVLPFRYAEVREGVNLEQNVTLRNGDVVIVP